jgi:hypothetical protein
LSSWHGMSRAQTSSHRGSRADVLYDEYLRALEQEGLI